METPKDIEKYGSHYTEDGLWNKLKRVAKKAGAKVVYAALLLYYVLQDDKVPVGDKIKIVGALGYFILPIDIVPDVIPIVGFTDDLAALTWALFSVAKNVTPEIKGKARAKLTEWFGNVPDSDLEGIG